MYIFDVQIQLLHIPRARRLRFVGGFDGKLAARRLHLGPSGPLGAVYSNKLNLLAVQHHLFGADQSLRDFSKLHQHTCMHASQPVIAVNHAI